MSVKTYLKEHPVASVLLAWTGADIIRMGVNLIKTKVKYSHVERVNEQRIKCGQNYDTLEYGCEMEMDDDKKEETAEQTEQKTEEGS